MASNTTSQPSIIGNKKFFWLHSPETGFDLTHPPTPTSSPIPNALTIQTTTSPIKIDPHKSALVIIDMQNFFLSPAVGKTRGPGHEALDQLVQHAIPACRKSGIQVIWLNWGLTEEDIENMSPANLRAFGFNGLDKHGRPTTSKYKGLGNPMGIVKDPETAKEIDAGTMLMRDQWNTALYPPLDSIYETGRTFSSRPDVWIHKNRMSGMWGSWTDCEEFLEKEGIKTLMFAGVNTDQCVGGTYQDAYSKGYDCILLNDGAATSSPEYAQQCWEYNAGNTWGFVVSCKGLADGVEGMKK